MEKLGHDDQNNVSVQCGHLVSFLVVEESGAEWYLML